MGLDLDDFRGFDGALILGMMTVFAPIWLPVWLVGTAVRSVLSCFSRKTEIGFRR